MLISLFYQITRYPQHVFVPEKTSDENNVLLNMSTEIWTKTRCKKAGVDAGRLMWLIEMLIRLCNKHKYKLRKMQSTRLWRGRAHVDVHSPEKGMQGLEPGLISEHLGSAQVSSRHSVFTPQHNLAPDNSICSPFFLQPLDFYTKLWLFSFYSIHNPFQK